MSHILKKIAIAGAGGGDKPKPPVFKPPILGDLQYGSSYSYAETLDLVSDGPIEGLVNREGMVLDGLNILEGIYLDGTPVAVTNAPVNPNINEDLANGYNLQLASSNGTAIKNCQKFFEELSLADRRFEGSPQVSALPWNGQGAFAKFNALEPEIWPSVGLLSWNHNVSRSITFWGTTVDDWDENAEWWVRGFIRSESGTPLTFPWHINGVRQTADGTSATKALWWQEDVVDASLNKIAWTNENDINDSNFFITLELRALLTEQDAQGIWGGTMFYGDHFPDVFKGLQDFAKQDLDVLADLFHSNSELDEDGQVNHLQRRLADKALSSLGWAQGPVDELFTKGTVITPNVEGNDEFGFAFEGENTGKGASNAYVILRVNEDSNSNLEGQNMVIGGAGFNQVMLPMKTVAYGATLGWDVENILREEGVEKYDVTCPIVDSDGVLTGAMRGFIVYKIPMELATNWDKRSPAGDGDMTTVTAFSEPVMTALKDIESLRYTKVNYAEAFVDQYTRSNLKFNYTNILAEVRKGAENQPPFNYFRTVFIDHPYSRELFGPYDATNEANLVGHGATQSQRHAPQRISANRRMLSREAVLGPDANNFNTRLDDNGLPIAEGSDDLRTNEDGRANFSDWIDGSVGNWDEVPIPTVHTVYNPNVTRAFITLNIAALNDTLVKEVPEIDAADKGLETAVKFPSVLNLKVETGTLGLDEQGNEGLEVPFKTYLYRVVALIDGSTLIDLVNPDYSGDSTKEYIISLDGNDQKLTSGFQLPPTVSNKEVLLSADGERGIQAGTIDQDSTEKRYIKVTKLSYETNSVLLNKVVQLNKITEIIDIPMPYPFSAIIGTKIDSRTFQSIPLRTFDCKLKKVKVPSNYSPVRRNGKDKRYYANQTAFDAAKKRDKLVYEGDWDGSFKTDLQWTDNPAWILYDLLTNYRYGMGSHIDVTDINKWQLYKIGRFCDAVDENGYFEGVTDGRGGKEPRFSCNIVFDKGQKIFDAITTIAALFRGRVFFGNSEINFVDDRPRAAVNIFTNENVKDGLFFYSNNRRDEQYNCIEVGFRDRFDNFVPKIEVVEDEDNIKEKGIFKKKIEGVGITSRAMARRLAQHQIFSRIKENQQVAFTAGLETLLCQPGDLVFIEDELKTNKANFGKVLAVDLDAETIRVSNTFVDSQMNGVVTIIDPTGRDSSLDIQTGYASRHRTRYYEAGVTGVHSDSWARYTGGYGFSGYTEGYTGASGVGEARYDRRFQQYALYTGLPESGTMLYFETGVTGWVFGSGTGTPDQGNSSAFYLGSGDFISELTGDQTLVTMGTGKITALDMDTADHRSTDASDLVAFSGFDNDAYVMPTRGALATDLSGINPKQLKLLSVTGNILSTPAELENAGFNNYGSVLSGFDKPEILPFVKLGSAARVEIKDADPFIYKVLSMKEENPNEYLVTATKYDTGKFRLIEDNISIEQKADTFSYQQCQTVNEIQYCTLNAPDIYKLVTGIPDPVADTFSISGDWSEITEGTGYQMVLNFPNGVQQVKSVTTTGEEFTNLTQVGVYNLCVNALGDKGGDGKNAYFDSQYDCSGIFVVYDELLRFNKSFIDRIDFF